MAPENETVPYADGYAHLRDELRRVWMAVEYRVRERWELGILPRSPGEGSIGAGIWGAGSLASMFETARRVTGSDALVEDGGEAAMALATFREQSARIEARILATVEAGVALPLIEVERAFHLTRLQRLTLTFALMTEFDPDLLIAYRYLSNDPTCRGLDARLLAMLVYETPESRPHLSLDLSALSPLIHFRLLEVDDIIGLPDPALYRRIQPAPRMVQIAAEGANDLDPQLREFATLAAPAAPGLFDPEVLRRGREALLNPGVMLVLQGARGTGKRLLVRNLAQDLGQRVMLLKGNALATLDKTRLPAVLHGLLREARLLHAVPVLPELGDAMARLDLRDDLPDFVDRLAAEHEGPLVLTFTGEHLPRVHQRPLVHVQLKTPPRTVRGEMWRNFVEGIAPEDAERLADRFAVPGGTVFSAAEAARSEPEPTNIEVLDRAVRAQLHDRLSRLGRKLDTPFTFDDLVLEGHIMDTLFEIGSSLLNLRRVREDWGLRGAPGISVLFSGSPGVGKTMSATVLARELGLAVYEIDLSAVVSKWIGETEKNLEEIFQAAEPGHAILLFNEADSLFGKRTSEVRSSNDRYANMETNYLLQRLEKFAGVAILTTNLSGAIDAAFRRRFAYDVHFSFPTVEMRAELWRRAIPAQLDASLIDAQFLAERFELSGGFIKLALERSAFVAADSGVSLSTEIIVPTIERMYQERGKLEATGKLE